jgi:RNA polymerase sigma-70 factor (ECF subfamily)
MEGVDERTLVERGLLGEAQEFKKIVDAYSPPLLALALNILGNREDAEDACQETFLRAFHHRDSFDVERSLRNWLMTILYRRCLDHLKKRKRFRGFVNRSAWNSPNPVHRLPAAPDPGPKPLPPRLLEFLTPRERTALSLWANEDYTAEEIARVIACSASTARVYLFNARKKIKAFLEKDHVAMQTR